MLLRQPRFDQGLICCQAVNRFVGIAYRQAITQGIDASRSRKASCGSEFGTRFQDALCNHGDAKLFQLGIVRWDDFIEATVVDGLEHCRDVVMGHGANEIERIFERFVEVVLALESMHG